ncbi:MAG: HAD family phosphatase [Pseudomonadota bacterium]
MTSLPKIQAVIFDIGNVLITWAPERYYDRVYGQDRRRALFADLDLHEMNDQIDRGADFKDTIYAWADANPEWRREIRDWHDHWLTMAGPPIEGSIACLRALRAKGMPVFALSNFGIGSFAITEVHWPVLTEFDRRYISGHMKTAKPDAAIYAMVEADCAIDPRGLLFIDDRPENIAAAAARGWQTHLFDGPGPLRARLEHEGLL